jgi:hypothetical protein
VLFFFGDQEENLVITTQRTEKRNIVSLELVAGVTYPRKNENSENENSVRFMDV